MFFFISGVNGAVRSNVIKATLLCLQNHSIANIMCHPLSEVGLNRKEFWNVTRLKPVRKVSNDVDGNELKEQCILSGLRCKRCWYCLRYSSSNESTKVLRLNAQSSPLFPTQLHENDCIDFHTWISVILIQRETVISVCRFASLICCCLFHVYVNETLSSNQKLEHKCCADSPTPADTNGTAGNGNQSSDHTKSSVSFIFLLSTVCSWRQVANWSNLSRISHGKSKGFLKCFILVLLLFD